MTKRILYFSTSAYLSLSNKQLVWKIPEVEKSEALSEEEKAAAVRTFPIEDIGVVVLDNRHLTITHGLLEALLAANCAIVTCNLQCMPVGLMLPLDGHSLQQERFTSQIEASLPLRKQLWQQTIHAKIANQEKLLRKHTNAETGCMKTWAANVRSGDPDNLEGRAAVYYWKNIFGVYVPNFRRDRNGTPPNQLLNYGYAILRAVIARALVCSGLLPTLGIHHHNRYNAYCLADDIMEPYRPYVDEVVCDIVRSWPYSELTRTLKAKLLAIPNAGVFIGGQQTQLQTAAALTASSLAKCFTGEARSLIYPEFNPNRSLEFMSE